jgi:hypothetical protein
MLLAVMLLGCSQPAEGLPDAKQRPPIDASLAVDATPQPDSNVRSLEGCSMGNLPAARTLTIGTADVVPSALIDELQDRDITANGLSTIIVPFSDFCDLGASSGAGSVSQIGELWQISGQRSLIAGLRLRPGQVVSNLVAKMQQSVASTGSLIMLSLPFAAGSPGFTTEASGATPTTTGSAILTPNTPVSITVTASKMYYLRFNTTASAGTTILWAAQLTLIGP